MIKKYESQERFVAYFTKSLGKRQETTKYVVRKLPRADAVQVEAILQEELGVHLHFIKLKIMPKTPGTESNFTCCASFPY